MEIEYFPLLPTLMGGLLAILGGFLTNMAVQSSIKNREIRQIKNQKAEELYKLILKVDHYCACLANGLTTSSIHTNAPEEVKLGQYQYLHIEMLVELYFPKAQDVSKLYLNVRSEVVLHVMTCLHIHKDRNLYPDNAAIEEMEGLISKLNSYSAEFRRKIKEACA